MAKHTLQGTKKKKISHTGFRNRMKTVSGRKIIKRRRRKKRAQLAY